MLNEKIEEETYSIIFRTLKHPIRRKILRTLVVKPLGFSEILETLQIDSGHLSYHMESLGELVKHSSNGKYELSSVGKAAVNLMSGVEERPQLSNIGFKLRSKKFRKIMLGVTLAALAVSAAINVYYFSVSQDLTRRIQGATGEAASGFSLSLLYAKVILDSKAEPENVFALISSFELQINSAISYLRALRIYLIPSYHDSFELLEKLFWNMTVGGTGGVSDTFDRIDSTGNISLVVEAYEQLGAVASERIWKIGFEVGEAFVGSLMRDHTVEIFSLNSTRLDNAVRLGGELKIALDQWIVKYS